MAEPLGQRSRGERGELAERPDPELLEDLRERLQLWPGAQERHRQGSEEVTRRPLLHHDRPGGATTRCTPARPCPQRRRVGREAAGRRPEARPRPERPAGGREHPVEAAPVDALERPRGEEGHPRAIRLHGRADPLEPVEHVTPQGARSLGIGRHQTQGGTARKRLPQPHAADDAEGLGGRRHLPHHLLAPRLGRQRGRLGEERSPVPESGQELEAGIENADHH